MKLTIKHLSGAKLVLDIESTSKVIDLKKKIQDNNNDYEPSRQKLILKGRMLQDEDTIESIGVTEADFVVCMLQKPKPAVPARASVSATSAAPTTVAPSLPSPTTTASAGTSSTSTASTVSASSTSSTTPSTSTVNIDPAQVEALVSTGFPEGQVRAALAAANGNPDLAFALLEGGGPIPIPPTQQQPAPMPGLGPSGTAAGITPTTLQQFRNHPHFNSLRRIVQQRPSAMGQVLETIRYQSPQLHAAIMQDQNAFIALMNEPITEDSASQPAGAGQLGIGLGPQAMAGGLPQGLEGLGGAGQQAGPQEILQLLQSLPPQERNQFLSQILGIPPDQVEQYAGPLMQAIASGGAGTLGGMPGMGGMGAGPAGGGHRIELTQEEAAQLNNLVEMGFDRNEALQVYLACGKNVEAAASILFENAEGGGPGGEPSSGAGHGGTGGAGDGDDQMY